MEEAVSRSLPPTAPTSSVIGRIEKELRDIWTTDANDPKSRAITMNLVVVAGSRELADRYVPVVDEVTRSVPARAIVVSLDTESISRALEGEATAVCSPGDSGAVCSERIRLFATGQVCARVGSAVEALCVPEIPTAVVWLGRVHTEDPIFVSVAKDAQRIVLDTEFTSLTSLMGVARWARADATRPKIADLAWTRLSAWQEMFARFFDEPRLREMANRITRISLRQASEPGARLGSEGALFLGWVATRLGWTSSRLGGGLRFKRPDGAEVRVQLGVVKRPEVVAPSALAVISVLAESDHAVVRGSIERDLASGLDTQTPDADMMMWKLEVDDAVPYEHRVRLSANKASRILERTLHRPAHDQALVDSIAFAEQVFEDGITCT
jgi:glucose-6-phosphate dehydrogenase assembly protein OpcA